jgi:hypothetical protein
LDNENTLSWNDYALTTRDIEQAFHFFVPDQTMYVAGEVYTTQQDGIYDVLDDGARQYTCFYAKKDVRFAQRSKELKYHDLRQHISAPIPELLDVGGVLALGYAMDCKFQFRNYGVRRPKKGTATSEIQIPIGYDLEREAIILRFDSLICDEVICNSLLAVLMGVATLRFEKG